MSSMYFSNSWRNIFGVFREFTGSNPPTEINALLLQNEGKYNQFHCKANLSNLKPSQLFLAATLHNIAYT